MYVPLVLALMLILPLLSIVAQFILTDRAALRVRELHRCRNRLQNAATASDLFGALLLTICCLARRRW